MNSLRVDVILESEQRSASPVSLKLIGRLSGIVAGVVILVLVGSFVARMKLAQNELDSLKSARAKLEPTLKKVKSYKTEVRDNKEILAQIKGWNNARLLWHRHMADFQGIVPKEIQITRFQVSEQYLVEGNVAAVELEGRAEAKDPAGAVKAVDDLRTLLKSGPGFSNMVETVELRECNEPKGMKNHRVFKISARYLQRAF